MTNQLLADDLPPRGHNNPPSLIDELIVEIAPLAARANDLIEVAATAVIVDDESAGKIINLGQMMASLEKELEEARVARGAPFLEATRAVNAAYNPLIEQLALVRAGPVGADKKRRGGLRGMLQAFKDKREVEAEAARQIALADQRRREGEAAAARDAAQAAATAQASGKGSTGDLLNAQLVVLKAQEEAAAAARRAEAIRPEPVRAQLGSLGSQRSIAFDITDTRKLVAWMVKQPMKGNLEQALRTIMGSYLRQLGVDSVARGVEIPGLSAWVDTQAAIRR